MDLGEVIDTLEVKRKSRDFVTNCHDMVTSDLQPFDLFTIE